jgi:VWFA-related protein
MLQRLIHSPHDAKPTRRGALSLLSAAPLLASPGNLFGQEDPVIRIDVSLVNITFTVRNKQGGLVGNLTQDDFQVFEDGKPQKITRFQRDNDLPLTIGMLIDVSGSMYNVLDVGKRAASEFFKKVLRPKDLAFLISFGSETELLQDLTSSTEYLDKGLGQVRGQRPTAVMTQGPVPTRQRGTLLYDAIYLAAQEKLKNESGRKVIVLLTDGADMGSYYKQADALKQSHLADAVIYSFFYYEPMFTSDEGALKRMSSDTGGRVFDAYRRGALEMGFKQLEEEMRSQYALSYAPVNSNQDGTFRRVEIKPKDGSLKVQARRGYYAGGNA